MAAAAVERPTVPSKSKPRGMRNRIRIEKPADALSPARTPSPVSPVSRPLRFRFSFFYRLLLFLSFVFSLASLYLTVQAGRDDGLPSNLKNAVLK